MKRNFSFFVVMLLLFAATGTFAQTSVHIFFQPDTAYYKNKPWECMGVNDKIVSNVGGKAIGYIAEQYPQLGDSLTVKIDFGDATTLSYKVPIRNNDDFEIRYNYGYTYWAGIPHTYTTPGVYNIKYKATAPDGKSDSIVFYGFIVETCDTIKGKLYADLNNNCNLDASDELMTYPHQVNLNLNGQSFATTNSIPADSSKYYFFVPANNNYEISAQNNYNGVFCPSTISVTSLPSLDNNFGYNCTADSFDLTGTISSDPFGFIWDPVMHVSVINTGCTPVSGKMKLVYNNSLLSVVSSTQPFTVSADTVIWNFTNLACYSSTGYPFTADITFHVNPSAVLGDPLDFKLIETPKTGDVDTFNNTQIYQTIIRSSWDPNDKNVLPQGTGVEHYINKNLNMTYTLRFQNTGNDYAGNIYIIDTIDSNLDISTLTLLARSHNTQVLLMGNNIVKFNMPCIYLPDSGADMPGSQGYVQYSVRQKANLAEGTVLKNTGYIYFDFNPAVQTNTVFSTINYSAGVSEKVVDGNYCTVYPNPGNGQFNIVLDKVAESTVIEVRNITGMLMLSKKTENFKQGTIDISTFGKGVYFITVQTDKYTISEKLILN